MRPLFDWLLQSYGDAIADPSTLHSAFVTNRAYAGLKAPVEMREPDRTHSSGQLVPDFEGAVPGRGRALWLGRQPGHRQAG